MTKYMALVRMLLAGLSILACAVRTDTDVTSSCLNSFDSQSIPIINWPLQVVEQVRSGGIVERENGFVAFERYDSEVVAFDSSGSVRWIVGRPGNGPFEFAEGRAYERLWFGNARWVHALENKTAVFDGRSIIVMRDSTFSIQVPVPSQMVSGFSRVHFVHWGDSATVLLAIERDPVFAQRDEDRYRVDLMAFPIDGKVSTALHSWPTLPWPEMEGGIPVHGVGESSASIAVRGSCAVFSDGHSDTLRITDLSDGRSASITIDMPDRFAEQSSAETYAKLGVPQSREVPVRYQARIARLAIDPSGQIWIIPARRVYSGEVWRVPRGASTVVPDTIDDARERVLFSDH